MSPSRLALKSIVTITCRQPSLHRLHLSSWPITPIGLLSTQKISTSTVSTGSILHLLCLIKTSTLLGTIPLLRICSAVLSPMPMPVIRRSNSVSAAGPGASTLPLYGIPQCCRFIGHRYFSKAVSSSDSRQIFTHNILAVYNQYDLDGIDIDWEYPGQIGQSGNTATPTDSANFLCFLILLRSALPPAARITAATQSMPFAGPDGNPMTDVSAFAGVLDWILLMNYDVWGCTYLLIPSYIQ